MHLEFGIIEAMKLSDRLNTAMEEAGINAKQLAQKVGQTEANISHVLSGRNKSISADAAREMARLLNVRLMWLLYGDGPMRPSDTDRLTEAAEGLTPEQIAALVTLAEQLKKP